jgi:hypothetical protein
MHERLPLFEFYAPWFLLVTFLIAAGGRIFKKFWIVAVGGHIAAYGALFVASTVGHIGGTEHYGRWVTYFIFCFAIAALSIRMAASVDWIDQQGRKWSGWK